MSFEKKVWRANDDLTEKEMNDFDKRVGDEFEGLSNKVQEVENIANLKHEVRAHIATITLIGGGAHIWWDNTTFVSVQIIELLDTVEGITYSSDIGVTNMYNEPNKRVTSYFYRLKDGSRIPQGTRLKVIGFYLVR